MGKQRYLPRQRLTLSPKVSGIDLVGIHLPDTTRTTEANEGLEEGQGHESDDMAQCGVFFFWLS